MNILSHNKDSFDRDYAIPSDLWKFSRHDPTPIGDIHEMAVSSSRGETSTEVFLVLELENRSNSLEWHLQCWADLMRYKALSFAFYGDNPALWPIHA